MSGPTEIARTAWGDTMPDWIETLARECEATSQNRVAARINRSAALISQLLRRKYPGDLAGIEERVRAEFTDAAIQCPVLGKMPASECLQWRRKGRSFQNTNSLRVKMFRACLHCPMNRKEHRNG